ncbi:hypothetical protein Lepto7375DRAFT_7379 [Leptolyngbya sp. PCC 7375]|nr:hypothetical protein Lepto7375DRAFT_7379 [Leptolyngbya sp. PCC 7375]
MWRPPPTQTTPLSVAHLLMADQDGVYPLIFNDPVNALIPFIRTPFTQDAGLPSEVTSPAYILGDGISLLDDSGGPIPEGSDTEGRRVRLDPGALWEINYHVSGQDIINAYVDVGLMDAAVFEAQIAAGVPSPQRLGLLNYGSDATLEPEDRTDNLRGKYGLAWIDLREKTQPMTVCLGAYNVNNPNPKNVAWWHTFMDIRRIF